MKKSLFMLILISLFVMGCTASYNAHPPDGFFMGLWHGLISPFTLILSLFTDVLVYSRSTTGIPYIVGFVIGVLNWIGPAAASKN